MAGTNSLCHCKNEIHLRGNLVPVTAGQTLSTVFSIGDITPTAAPSLPGAILRTGANGVSVYRHSLPNPTAGLAWLPDHQTNALIPEIRMFRAREIAGNWQPDSEEWTWVRSFLGEASSTRRIGILSCRMACGAHRWLSRPR